MPQVSTEGVAMIRLSGLDPLGVKSATLPVFSPSLTSLGRVVSSASGIIVSPRHLYAVSSPSLRSVIDDFYAHVYNSSNDVCPECMSTPFKPNLSKGAFVMTGGDALVPFLPKVGPREYIHIHSFTKTPNSATFTPTALDKAHRATPNNYYAWTGVPLPPLAHGAVVDVLLEDAGMRVTGNAPNSLQRYSTGSRRSRGRRGSVLAERLVASCAAQWQCDGTSACPGHTVQLARDLLEGMRAQTHTCASAIATATDAVDIARCASEDADEAVSRMVEEPVDASVDAGAGANAGQGGGVHEATEEEAEDAEAGELLVQPAWVPAQPFLLLAMADTASPLPRMPPRTPPRTRSQSTSIPPQSTAPLTPNPALSAAAAPASVPAPVCLPMAHPGYSAAATALAFEGWAAGWPSRHTAAAAIRERVRKRASPRARTRARAGVSAGCALEQQVTGDAEEEEEEEDVEYWWGRGEGVEGVGKVALLFVSDVDVVDEEVDVAAADESAEEAVAVETASGAGGAACVCRRCRYCTNARYRSLPWAAGNYAPPVDAHPCDAPPQRSVPASGDPQHGAVQPDPLALQRPDAAASAQHTPAPSTASTACTPIPPASAPTPLGPVLLPYPLPRAAPLLLLSCPYALLSPLCFTNAVSRAAVLNTFTHPATARAVLRAIRAWRAVQPHASSTAAPLPAHPRANALRFPASAALTALTAAQERVPALSPYLSLDVHAAPCSLGGAVVGLRECVLSTHDSPRPQPSSIAAPHSHEEPHSLPAPRVVSRWALEGMLLQPLAQVNAPTGTLRARRQRAAVASVAARSQPARGNMKVAAATPTSGTAHTRDDTNMVSPARDADASVAGDCGRSASFLDNRYDATVSTRDWMRKNPSRILGGSDTNPYRDLLEPHGWGALLPSFTALTQLCVRADALSACLAAAAVQAPPGWHPLQRSPALHVGTATQAHRAGDVGADTALQPRHTLLTADDNTTTTVSTATSTSPTVPVATASCSALTRARKHAQHVASPCTPAATAATAMAGSADSAVVTGNAARGSAPAPALAAADLPSSCSRPRAACPVLDTHAAHLNLADINACGGYLRACEPPKHIDAYHCAERPCPAHAANPAATASVRHISSSLASPRLVLGAPLPPHPHCTLDAQYPPETTSTLAPAPAGPSAGLSAQLGLERYVCAVRLHNSWASAVHIGRGYLLTSAHLLHPHLQPCEEPSDTQQPQQHQHQQVSGVCMSAHIPTTTSSTAPSPCAPPDAVASPPVCAYADTADDAAFAAAFSPARYQPDAAVLLADVPAADHMRTSALRGDTLLTGVLPPPQNLGAVSQDTGPLPTHLSPSPSTAPARCPLAALAHAEAARVQRNAQLSGAMRVHARIEALHLRAEHSDGAEAGEGAAAGAEEAEAAWLQQLLQHLTCATHAHTIVSSAIIAADTPSSAAGIHGPVAAAHAADGHTAPAGASVPAVPLLSQLQSQPQCCPLDAFLSDLAAHDHSPRPPPASRAHAHTHAHISSPDDEAELDAAAFAGAWVSCEVVWVGVGPWDVALLRLEAPAIASAMENILHWRGPAPCNSRDLARVLQRVIATVAPALSLRRCLTVTADSSSTTTHATSTSAFASVTTSPLLTLADSRSLSGAPCLAAGFPLHPPPGTLSPSVAAGAITKLVHLPSTVAITAMHRALQGLAYAPWLAECHTNFFSSRASTTTTASALSLSLVPPPSFLAMVQSDAPIHSGASGGLLALALPHAHALYAQRTSAHTQHSTASALAPSLVSDGVFEGPPRDGAGVWPLALVTNNCVHTHNPLLPAHPAALPQRLRTDFPRFLQQDSEGTVPRRNSPHVVRTPGKADGKARSLPFPAAILSSQRRASATTPFVAHAATAAASNPHDSGGGGGGMAVSADMTVDMDADVDACLPPSTPYTTVLPHLNFAIPLSVLLPLFLYAWGAPCPAAACEHWLPALHNTNVNPNARLSLAPCTSSAPPSTYPPAACPPHCLCAGLWLGALDAPHPLATSLWQLRDSTDASNPHHTMRRHVPRYVPLSLGSTPVLAAATRRELLLSLIVQPCVACVAAQLAELYRAQASSAQARQGRRGPQAKPPRLSCVESAASIDPTHDHAVAEWGGGVDCVSGVHGMEAHVVVCEWLLRMLVIMQQRAQASIPTLRTSANLNTSIPTTKPFSTTIASISAPCVPPASAIVTDAELLQWAHLPLAPPLRWQRLCHLRAAVLRQLRGAPQDVTPSAAPTGTCEQQDQREHAHAGVQMHEASTPGVTLSTMTAGVLLRHSHSSAAAAGLGDALLAATGTGARMSTVSRAGDPDTPAPCGASLGVGSTLPAIPSPTATATIASTITERRVLQQLWDDDARARATRAGVDVRWVLERKSMCECRLRGSHPHAPAYLRVVELMRQQAQRCTNGSKAVARASTNASASGDERGEVPMRDATRGNVAAL